jgi:flavin reductase (DIM6/NTAB) family NADH-FMN oxidoreductase RutF
MAKIEQGLRPGLLPVPAAMITCIDREGKPNIITLAWVGVACSTPPMLSIAVRPHRYSAPMLKSTGEFVVNIPGVDQLWASDVCGTLSGKDVDKFQAAKLTPVPASKVKPPLIAECPVNIECVLRHTLALGSHDLFIGEVVAVHVDGECVDTRGSWDISKLKPFAYCVGTYWSMGEQIGVHGYSQVKK